MLKKIANAYNTIEEVLVGSGIFVGLAVILYNVITRYLFKSPHGSTEEISLIILSYAIILGFSVNMRTGNNIDMDIVYTAVKNKKIRWCMDVFSRVCLLLYSLFITYYGYQAVLLQYKIHRVYVLTLYPKWLAFAVVVYVGAVLSIRCLANLIGFLVASKKEEKQA